MSIRSAVLLTLIASLALPAVASPRHPYAVQIMPGLEGEISDIEVRDGGDHLIVLAKLVNTGEQFFAVALVPMFPKASSDNGTIYIMEDERGITRCSADNSATAAACIGKPFTQGITMAPGTYTVLQPGRTAALNFSLKRDRGLGVGANAVFSANFAIRTFSNLDEDAAQSDSTNYGQTRIQNVDFRKENIIDMASLRDKLTK